MSIQSFFKYILFISTVIFVLDGCGATNTGSAQTVAAATAPAVSTIGTTGTTGTGTTIPTTVANSCSHNVITKPLYSYPTVQGVGSGTAQTPYNGINGVDQDLQVLIVPGGSGATSGGGGTDSYQLMSMNVTLLHNGSPVPGATIHVPQSGQSYYGGANYGLPVGTQSTVLNFSSYLTQGNSGGNYSIQIQNVATDYECRQICLGSYYCTYEPGYGYYCDQNMIQECMQLQCDVGPAQANSSWSASVTVETDTTPCL